VSITMKKAFLVHCLSPLHPGTGQALDLIDLPIARYKATRIPFLPGSSIKGVARDARTPDLPRSATLDAAWSTFIAAFGPDVEKDDASEHAGAVSFGDARLLLMPVRSLRGTFAYVTSPLLLRLAHQDFQDAGLPSVPPIPDVPAPDRDGPAAQVPRALVPQLQDSVLVHRPAAAADVRPRLFLEDLDFVAAEHVATSLWAEWLGLRLFPERQDDLKRRFVVVDDEAMTFIWETATQVDAHNRINDRGTVADGQLWYQESLPPETVLLGLATATESLRQGLSATRAVMLATALKNEDVLQFGGKANTGNGRARLLAIA